MRARLPMAMMQRVIAHRAVVPAFVRDNATTS